MRCAEQRLWTGRNGTSSAAPGRAFFQKPKFLNKHGIRLHRAAYWPYHKIHCRYIYVTDKLLKTSQSTATPVHSYSFRSLWAPWFNWFFGFDLAVLLLAQLHNSYLSTWSTFAIFCRISSYTVWDKKAMGPPFRILKILYLFFNSRFPPTLFFS